MREHTQALERKIRLWVLQQERKRLEQRGSKDLTKAPDRPGHTTKVDHRQIPR